MKKENNPDITIRQQLAGLIRKGNAHVTFEQAVENLTIKLAGKEINGLPYTIWQLVEHIRITQWDVLEFSRNPGHKSPEWPEGYWVNETAPVDEAAWKESTKQILSDREAFIALLEDPQNNLHQAFTYGEGQDFFGEALLIADHNSYHIGEVILLRRLLNDWH